MNAVALPAPAAPEIEGEVQILENRWNMEHPAGQALVIADSQHYRAVSLELAEAKRLSRAIEAKRLELTRPLDAAKANVKAFFDKLRSRPDAIVRAIDIALNRYDEDQRAAARRAQRELDEQARREREFNEQRAARAAERGELERAAEIAAAPPPPAVVVAPKIPDVKGVTAKAVWKYRITDKSLLPREYLKEDDQAIGAMVRAKKGDTVIPGVEVYQETTRY